MTNVTKIQIDKVLTTIGYGQPPIPDPTKYIVTIHESNGVVRTITVKADLLTLVYEELNKLDGKGVFR